MCVSYRLICQCVIRVSCYENYTRNTQTALVCTLLPVSYMLRCACWTSVCTKLCRRGQDVEHHRRARCDGSSAPCSGGPQISPHSCAAGAEGPLILAGQNRDFPRGKVAPWIYFTCASLVGAKWTLADTGLSHPRWFADPPPPGVRPPYALVYRQQRLVRSLRRFSVRSPATRGPSIKHWFRPNRQEASARRDMRTPWPQSGPKWTRRAPV